MTIKEYKVKINKMKKEFDRKVELLQQQYVREYDFIKVGDLVRSRTGFKMTCKVQEINHFSEGEEIYTILTVMGVKKSGEPHSKSRVMKARDNDMIKIEV